MTTGFAGFMFALLAGISIWVMYTNATWFEENMPPEHSIKPIAFYILYGLLVVLLLPCVYMAATNVVPMTPSVYMTLTTLFLLITTFLVLWLIYLFHLHNTKLGYVFILIAFILSIISLIYLAVSRSGCFNCRNAYLVAGLIVCMSAWLGYCFYLTNAVHSQGRELMFKSLRERFIATKNSAPETDVVENETTNNNTEQL